MTYLCQHIRHVALAIPELWSFIDVRAHPELVTFHVARAHDDSLTIKFQKAKPGRMEAAVPNIAHDKADRIAGCRGKVLRLLLENSSPMILTLHVYGLEGEAEILALDQLGAQLNELYLMKCTIKAWSQEPILRNRIRRLRLDNPVVEPERLIELLDWMGPILPKPSRTTSRAIESGNILSPEAH
jgi:hypothetical protein